MTKHVITTLRDLLEADRGRIEQRIRSLERQLKNSLDGQSLLELFHAVKKSNQMVVLLFGSTEWMATRRKVVTDATERLPPGQSWSPMRKQDEKGGDDLVIHDASFFNRKDGEFFFRLGNSSSAGVMRTSLINQTGMWWNIKELHYLGASVSVEDIPS